MAKDPDYLIKEQFGRRLRLAREASGFATSNEAARIFNLENETYRLYEVGKRFPKPHILVALSERFNVTLDYLIKGPPRATNENVAKTA